METSNTYSNDNTYSFHKLKNKWSLYAHLPQDTDWSHNSYKLIYTFENIEEIISIINYLPETLIKFVSEKLSTLNSKDVLLIPENPTEKLPIDTVSTKSKFSPLMIILS